MYAIRSYYVTLTSLTPTRLYVLPQSAIVTWKEQFPHLRAKLQAYYQVYNNIGSMLKKKGLDRRQDHRITSYNVCYTKLLRMVRILAGTLIEIGQGKREATTLPEILHAKDRRRAGLTGPACGLGSPR